MISYTHKQIETYWEQFRKAQLYRCLVAGKWVLKANFQEAKALRPLKIEVKLAKDVIDFPSFLRIVHNGDTE